MITRVPQRLFAKATIGLLFAVVLALLVACVVSYIQDRKLQSVSLGNLRMATWNLAQLGHEASAFDRELALELQDVGDSDEMLLRYDILWSRYVYLLTSSEAAITRDHSQNEVRLTELFGALQSLETPITRLAAGDPVDRRVLATLWETQKAQVQRLVIDNFVGDETGQLMDRVEYSRNRLSNLRLLMLGAMVLVFSYLALAVMYTRRQAGIDQITGLPNHLYLRSLKRIDPAKAIITCEINEFQVVLSEYGHDTLAELTRAFVDRLRVHLREGDELIQVAQNQFLVVATPSPRETMTALVERLASATSFDWSLHDTVLHISSTLGADAPCQGSCPGWQARYQQVHRALAQARIEGRPFYINDAKLRTRLKREQAIHSALNRFLKGQPSVLRLSLVYQPIVSADNATRITGAEVLLRCQHQEEGVVPPYEVVDLCERYGLGKKLGQWLFREIAHETRDLYQYMGFRGVLSINLNPSMLCESLPVDVKTLLLGQGIPPESLCLEITEDNAALNFSLINRLIRKMHDLGLCVALDDFGTGHSSLEYVRELKVDRLKIDRCFVDGIENDSDKERFLGSIIAMANQASMKSVIEGVETGAQWRLVGELGGELIQGYYAYRPMPFNDLMALFIDGSATFPVDQGVAANDK